MAKKESTKAGYALEGASVLDLLGRCDIALRASWELEALLKSLDSVADPRDGEVGTLIATIMARALALNSATMSAVGDTSSDTDVMLDIVMQSPFAVAVDARGV